MKQRITQEQLDTLSDQQRYRYATWCDPKDELDWPWSSHGVIRKGKLPLLTIGQLIEFIVDHTKERGWLHIQTPSERCGWRIECKYVDFDEDDTLELVDALWSAVKVILSEE
jgi:hypothetical protein